MRYMTKDQKALTELPPEAVEVHVEPLRRPDPRQTRDRPQTGSRRHSEDARHV